MMVTFFSANFSNNELKPRPSAVQPGVSAFRVYNVQMLGKISSDVKHTSRFQMDPNGDFAPSLGVEPNQSSLARLLEGLQGHLFTVSKK